AGALILFWASLTPSLLPRSPVFQGIIAGVSALIGYAAGALLGWLVRRCGGRVEGVMRRRVWWVVGITGLAGSVVMVTAYIRWEKAVRAVGGLDRVGRGHVVA